MNNIRRETSRNLGGKEGKILKKKIDEFATNSKNNNIRNLCGVINVFKKGNLVKDENGDLLADSHNILNGWKNGFSLLLNVQRVSDVSHIGIRTTEPSVPNSGPFKVEIAIAKLKRIARQVAIRFRPNLFKQEVEYYVLRSIS
jgi:hypothetical protein